jgi:hypothetical protein
VADEMAWLCQAGVEVSLHEVSGCTSWATGWPRRSSPRRPARGARGREKHCAHFSPEATTGALIDIYERVLREAEHRTERAD